MPEPAIDSTCVFFPSQSLSLLDILCKVHFNSKQDRKKKSQQLMIKVRM